MTWSPAASSIGSASSFFAVGDLTRRINKEKTHSTKSLKSFGIVRRAYFPGYIKFRISFIPFGTTAKTILTSLLSELPPDLGTPMQYDLCPRTCSRSSGHRQGSPLPCALPCCKRSKCQASHTPWPGGQIQSTCSSCSPLGCTLWQSGHTWQINSKLYNKIRYREHTSISEIF